MRILSTIYSLFNIADKFVTIITMNTYIVPKIRIFMVDDIMVTFYNFEHHYDTLNQNELSQGTLCPKKSINQILTKYMYKNTPSTFT